MTPGERRPFHRPVVLLVVLLTLAGCARSSVRTPYAGPGAEAPGPTRRTVEIGLVVGSDSVTLGSRGGLRLRDGATGRRVAEGPGGRRWTVRPAPGGKLELRRRDGVSADAERRGVVARAGSVLAVPRREEALVTVDGRAYRGIVEVRHLTGRGLVVVNRLGLEAYLLGVVPAEIGPRRPEEMEAVKAQAVAARTYSLANLGRRDSLGFDMFGSIQDQVYGGVSVERPRVARAVRATAGQVLTYRGRPIRAYYHSTGGGRTAKVTDAWRLPDAPYLRRVEDARPGGGHWCEISPRYRWTERWSPAELDRAVHRGLADYFDADTARLGSVRAIGVRERTPAGRVTRLEVRVEGGRFVVTKNDIRFFLHTPDGRTLRSTHFEIVAAPQEEGGLVLRGRGYGHGIGMCQWGAIGRARAGQSYREILRAYYPGARLVRAY